MTRRPQQSKRHRDRPSLLRAVSRLQREDRDGRPRRRRRHEEPGPELFASGDPVDDLDRSYGPR